MEDRHVKLAVIAPDGPPVAFGQELLLGRLARDPAVQRRLDPAREHFHADHEVGAIGVQSGQGLKLPAVLFGAVVTLAQHDDGCLRRALEKLGSRYRAFGWFDPAGFGNAGLRRRRLGLPR